MRLPGDNEPPSWEELLAKPDFVEAIRGTDILLAPHHGRPEGKEQALSANRCSDPVPDPI